MGMELPALPDKAHAVVAAREIDRAKATKKLEDVLRIAATGDGPVQAIRTIAVIGSYARGAPRVGDIDLNIEIDDLRDEREAGLDDYYATLAGRNPDSPLRKQLKCSGSSMVSATIVRRFGEHPVPVAPEDWRHDLGPGYELAAPLRMAHVVTGQELAGPSFLLFVRGDMPEVALQRLHAIPENPTAARFERTTGVPLLDPLGGLLGVRAQYRLAALIKEGGALVRAVVLHPVDEVPASVTAFESRWFHNSLPGGKNRRASNLSAITFLHGEGVSADQISVAGAKLGDEDADLDVLVDWNLGSFHWLVDQLNPERYGRLLQILGAHRKGPWIALDCRAGNQSVLAAEKARDLADMATRMNARIAQDLGVQSPDG